MKLFVISVVALVVAAWIGTKAGHWMDKKAIEVNRPYLEEIAR